MLTCFENIPLLWWFWFEKKFSNIRHLLIFSHSVSCKTCQKQSGRFTSPRSMLHETYVFCATLQFCYVFYTTFSLSLISLFLECCKKYMQNLQRYTFSCIYCNVVRNAWRVCNVAYFQCIICNVLRWGRMGTIERLYKIHGKIATL